MSFFGFNKEDQKSYLRGHPGQAPGFGSAPDPFASISGNQDDDEEAIDFEDTYDGLGDQLGEEDDDLNDDTFGGGETKAPGKDFDFFGNTSKVSDAIDEEAMRFSRRQPAPKPLVPSATSNKPAQKPFKSGYETYRDPANMTGLQVDPSLWGTTPMNPTQSSRPVQPAASSAAPSRKMLSLEEIEAQMFQPKKPSPAPAPQQQPRAPSNFDMQERMQKLQQQGRQQTQASSQETPFSDPAIMRSMPQRSQQPLQHQGQQSSGRAQQSVSIAQPSRHVSRPSYGQPAEMPAQSSPVPQGAPPQILQRPQEPQQQTHEASQPRQILQNPNRQASQMDPRHLQQQPSMPPQARMVMPHHGAGPVSLPIITHPSQLKDLSEEQRQAFMIEDAKRAKRNHKIFLLSKDNGLMTPQDKNFITRIQLQQLMTATGNVNEADPDSSLSEDFYYQVYNQIENRPRQNPHQPLSNFAQTYLFQTGSRQGGMGRRNNRGGDSHVHRMQQQVQRAVEAAKAKPKGKQLVIEGSLGKISFSNAKTPKPLLNIKKQDTKLPQATLSSTNRKAILKNIEAVYSTLMLMEDHARRQPPPSADGEPSEALAGWRQVFEDLNQKLWFELKVMEPIMPESTVLHPFIAFLSYPKGKKAIPRIFSQIDPEQRLTILTIIMVQLDTLDVIRSALPQFSHHQSQSVAREQVDLFLQTVMPTLFSYVTEAPLGIVMGLLGLILDRVNVHAIAHTRVGLEIFTMFLSQAEIIRKAEATNDEEWEQWLGTYNRLFDSIEPILADIFPGAVSAGHDVYVWQFLATVGTGANPEQQQRLVLAVKDRVMETVQHSKTLPPDMATQRRANVNLFMQAIGLDVDLLDS